MVWAAHPHTDTDRPRPYYYYGTVHMLPPSPPPSSLKANIKLIPESKRGEGYIKNFKDKNGYLHKASGVYCTVWSYGGGEENIMFGTAERWKKKKKIPKNFPLIIQLS